MSRAFLDHKLDCKTCGTIRMDIPEGASEDTPIHCSTCHGYLGTWGELQNDFIHQAGDGVFDLDHGKIQQK